MRLNRHIGYMWLRKWLLMTRELQVRSARRRRPGNSTHTCTGCGRSSAATIWRTYLATSSVISARAGHHHPEAAGVKAPKLNKERMVIRKRLQVGELTVDQAIGLDGEAARGMRISN